MIDNLKPYQDMRDSELPWLGEVPAHWDVRRNGRLFGPRRETGFPDLPVLEVSLRSGVRVRDFDNSTRKQEMGDRSKYQRAVRGDIAYNMMRMWQGAVGIAPVDGLVSPAYVVARPFAETDAAYYAFVFRTAAYMREVDTFSRGIVPDRNRLYWESFKQMPSVYPPLDEQRLIVRFLDWHGAQTAKLIRAKKKIIALLDEQKQAIIHRAVTRGLDPNIRLKPSGIPWLGDVPEGWEVKRGKYVFGIIDVRSETGSEELLTVSSRKGVVRRSTQTVTMFKAASYVGHKLCWPEDLVINSLWAWANGLGFSQDHGIISTAYSVYRLRPGYGRLWQYLNYALRSGAYEKEFLVRSKGIWISRLQLSDQAFLDMPLFLPPPEDAALICDYIQRRTVALDTAIGGVEREIALIQEFRTRLIADVVTGKLDVRAAAAGLPETVEPEAIDDLAEDDDLDEAVDDAEDEEVAA